jgi:hypothetical protein
MRWMKKRKNQISLSYDDGVRLRNPSCWRMRTRKRRKMTSSTHASCDLSRDVSCGVDGVCHVYVRPQTPNCLKRMRMRMKSWNHPSCGDGAHVQPPSPSCCLMKKRKRMMTTQIPLSYGDDDDDHVRPQTPSCWRKMMRTTRTKKSLRTSLALCDPYDVCGGVHDDGLPQPDEQNAGSQ